MFRRRCAGLALLCFAACRHDVAADARPVRAVEEAAPEPKAEPIAEPAKQGFLGLVLAGDTVDLSSKSEGKLEAVLVRPGDHFVRGATLARLDRRLLLKDLSIARAELKDAEERYARRLPLAKSNEAAISREELSNARVQVLERRGKVDQLTVGLAEADIRAPFDGTVASRFFDAGALVGPGKPILRVISVTTPRVNFWIPEDRAGDVPVGTQVDIHLDATPGVVLPAHVESVAPEIDSAARMIFAVARLDLDKAGTARIKSGQSARVWPRPSLPATAKN